MKTRNPGVKSLRLAVAMSAAILAAAPAGPAAADDNAAPGAGVVARVDAESIRASDLEGYLALRPPDRGAVVDPSSVVRRLDEMILSEVLYQEALRLGLDRDPQVRMTLRQVTIQKLLELQVDRPVLERKIPEQELRGYYDGHVGEFSRPEQVRLADIFFFAPEAGDPAAREEKRGRAEAVLAEARTLQDKRFGFGELVLKHSDTNPRYPRGDTGYFDREGWPAGLAKALADAAFAIGKPGMLAAEVVQTPEGFHVVMLTSRRDALNRPFDDPQVRDEIARRLRDEERRRRREEFIAGLRGRADISVDDQAVGELTARMNARGGQVGAAGAASPGARGEAPPALPATSP